VCRDFSLAAQVSAPPTAPDEPLDDLSSETATDTATPSRQANESGGRVLGVSALRRFLSFDGTRW